MSIKNIHKSKCIYLNNTQLSGCHIISINYNNCHSKKRNLGIFKKYSFFW